MSIQKRCSQNLKTKYSADEGKIDTKGALVYNKLVSTQVQLHEPSESPYHIHSHDNDPYKVFEKTENFLAILGPYSS